MNYVLQVVRGRSDAATVRLADGVNSVGRHDDCLIRIRSSQVSRRHCELFENEGQLWVRDLGSANGTYVNGKRVLGQQALKIGDVITVGGVTLRVEQAGAPGAGTLPGKKPSDTAVADAVPLPDDEDVELEFEDEEFEISMDDQPQDADIIPMDDEPTAPAQKPAPNPAGAGESDAAKDADITEQPEPAASSSKPSQEEEEAVAQFLMDLKLDEDE
jgi:pSer/pThr/pTyr-binding forkhead associated (FHA) protein